jgi:chromate transport protein ChrA
MQSLISFSLWAINQSQLESLTTYGALVPIIIGIVIFKFAVSAIVRSVVLILALALGALIYNQRSEISNCVEKAKDTSAIDCSFYGYDFTFSL